MARSHFHVKPCIPTRVTQGFFFREIESDGVTLWQLRGLRGCDRVYVDVTGST